ncbi:hypothetical protein SK128_010453 [Halocaridina rubra]|uniref:Gamma-tubulin complex component n=1 Tax=Halocaridina rubra TaxID=373956 RepID=A0AAN8WJN8_HALRR
MLHDLILALTGHGGDIFVKKDDDSFEVVNDLGFFHPCEVAIIRRLLNIGSHYKKITKFCDAYDTVHVNREPDYRGGLYLSSLAGALRKSVKVYQTSVLGLEAKLLEDPELPLSYLLNDLEPLSPLLAAFASLVLQIEEKRVHGCKILEVLHRQTSLSVSNIRESFLRIEQAVHSVLYDQLTQWMLYGILLDNYNELFIQTISTTITSSAETPDASQPDTVNLLEYEAPKVSQECTLRLEMLPSHIPLHLAEKILFIGESILVFEREGKKDTSIEFTSHSSHFGNVLKSKEQEFLGLLRSLTDGAVFSIAKFSNVVETIRHCISKELCALVLGADLLPELDDLKSFYLLGRGELYQTLIPAITPFMKNTPASKNSNFNALFQMAGRQVLLEDEVLEKFTLVRKPPSVAQSSESFDQSWNSLKIEYSAKWPLHKLLTTSIQERYNAIFCFLLDVRRAQYRLQQLWITQIKMKAFSTVDSLPWTLRHQMSLLIDNIQYYFQVDVLESQHWQLVAAIGNTHDYQRLALAHHDFLVSVSASAF